MDRQEISDQEAVRYYERTGKSLDNWKIIQNELPSSLTCLILSLKKELFGQECAAY